ncbi:MAG TPA: TolC family protein [Verrucomicrobiae bacterium]|nr:TolC family protein [Verrucomicrobiae bacterium]
MRVLKGKRTGGLQGSQKPILISCWFLFLAGCAHFVPQPIAPSDNLRRFEARSLSDPGLRQYAVRALKGEFPAWPPVAWDLRMLTLAALYFHPDMEAARARLALAEAGKITAGQRPNPTLSVGPSLNSTTILPSPWLVTASLDVPIETAGKRGHRLAQARHLSEAAAHGVATAAWGVRSRLRSALLEAWAAEESGRLLEQQLAAQDEIVRLIEGRLTAGAAAPMDLSRERVALERTRMDALDARNRRAQSTVRLAAALGVPTKKMEGVPMSFDAFTRPPRALSPAEARRRALLSRADIRAALAEYAATESALQLEIAKQYPDVHLGPAYEFDQGDHKWGLGLNLELPLLNRNRGPIAEAEARRREAAAKFNGLQASVLGEIEGSLAEQEAARQKVAAAEKLVSELARQEHLAKGSFEAGEISREAVAAAAVERTSAALAQFEARVRWAEAQGRLEAALQSPLDMPPPAAPPWQGNQPKVPSP